MSEAHKSQRSEAVLTPEVRIAYPFVHEKRTKRANGTPMPKPRFDSVLLLPKLHTDPAQCPNYKFLSDLCMQAATKAWGSWPAGGHWPIQDGDAPPKPKAPVPGQAPAVVDPAKSAWRKGHWVIEATSYLDTGPRVAVMQGGQPVEIPARVIAGKTMYKSGDYGIASISAFTFQNEKFGVNFGLEGILFTREGERIGSGGQRSAAEMFGGVAPPASVAPPGLPPQPPGLPPQYAPPATPTPQYAPNPPGMPPSAVAQSFASPPGAVAQSFVAPPPTPAYAAPPSAPPLPPFPGRQ
jgi:hypothetical protein